MLEAVGRGAGRCIRFTTVLLPVEAWSTMSNVAWVAFGVMSVISISILACSSAAPAQRYTLFPTSTTVATSTPAPSPEPTAGRTHQALRTPTIASMNNVRPTPTSLEVVSDAREVEVTREPGKAGSTSDRPRPTPINTLSPEEIPEGVSPALAQDAQMYAVDFGVELPEAIRRLTLQRPIGKLGATLESNEADTLGGFWIQHEPEFRVVAAFTMEGEETIAKYVQDGPLMDIIEVRTVDATLEELKRSQREAGAMVTGLGFQAASGINVFENRAEIYVPDRSRLEEALQNSGQTLPAHVHIVEQGLPERLDRD